MEYKEFTIYETLESINKNEIVLPAIQRNFVWEKDQIDLLFESVLSKYPISSFLFWKLTPRITRSQNNVFFRFQDLAYGNTYLKSSPNRLQDYELKKARFGILDGQQRLSSMYIVFYGKYKIRPAKAWHSKTQYFDEYDLYFDLNANLNSDDKFEFLKEGKQDYFRVKDIQNFYHEGLDEQALDENIIEYLINKNITLSKRQHDNLFKLSQTFFIDKAIKAFIIDNNENDALEIFIRLNSGGTKLTKTDLVFSKIEASWPDAREKIDAQIDKMNPEYAFSREFIILCLLYLYGEDGELSSVNIGKNVTIQAKDDWDKICQALDMTKKLIAYCGFDSHNKIGSYNALVPIFGFVFYNPGIKLNENRLQKEITHYLMRAFFGSVFSSSSPHVLTRIRKNIKEQNQFYADKLYKIKDVKSDTIENLLKSEKNDKTRLCLYILHKEKSNTLNQEQDHIHPRAIFLDNSNKPESIDDSVWTEWVEKSNCLPNLHLLTENKNKSKSKKPLRVWLKEKNITESDFKATALIPNEASLEFDKFDEFYELREKILRSKLETLFGVLTTRKINATFEMLEIPINSVLIFEKNKKITCLVSDLKNSVIYNEKKYTISKLASEFIGYPVNGFSWFRYENETLSHRRERLENQ
jgi:5-methylcytosine-specific restriction endonuclease McrA